MPTGDQSGVDPRTVDGLLPSLNLGVLAHVDAGKTSLTERILFEAGVVEEVGSVDAGTTLTDSMDIERRRGITVRSAVTSFRRGGVAINIIDTPGHPDFIAEVERALAILDGAILVLSAAEGVQPQTTVIWRALQRLGVPTVMFINKVDRANADPLAVLDQIRARLTADIVPLSRVTFDPGPNVQQVPWDDPAVIEALAAVCPATLDEWASNMTSDREVLLDRLRHRVARAQLTPVLAGSALTGCGVAALTDAVVQLLPSTRPQLDKDPAGAIFNIDRDSNGKRAFVRMYAGSLSVRDTVVLSSGKKELIRSVQVAADGSTVDRDQVVGGQIAVLRGLNAAQVGDTIGHCEARSVGLAPPTLEAVVEAVDDQDRIALYAALSELAEHDPLIRLRRRGASDEIAVSLFGEVQKEVIAALLYEWYGVEARFRESTVIYIERVLRSAVHVEHIRVGDNPYLGTVGLRIEPASPGAGVRFTLEVEKGSMPSTFFAATEEGVRAALQQGLYGWQVTDCVVTMTHAGYLARQSRAHQKFNKGFSSVAADFRLLGQLVVTAALQQARTVVHEPVDRFEVEVPTDALQPVLSWVEQLQGRINHTDTVGELTQLRGYMRTGSVRDLASRLPDLTNGEGTVTHEIDHYEPVSGPPPSRQRVGPDPGNRDEWFRKMPR
ncbi:GTP-binding protein [Nocardioides sp.]|uniref:GTP-binding protein n=1 Tax=Nocardioides sp. TaxID=35761 RepID=UPI003516AE73